MKSDYIETCTMVSCLNRFSELQIESSINVCPRARVHWFKNTYLLAFLVYLMALKEGYSTSASCRCCIAYVVTD